MTCEPGHFYNKTTSSCSQCQKGFYQPRSGQDFCFSCPGKTSTDFTASVSEEDCKGENPYWVPLLFEIYYYIFLCFMFFYFSNLRGKMQFFFYWFRNDRIWRTTLKTQTKLLEKNSGINPAHRLSGVPTMRRSILSFLQIDNAETTWGNFSAFWRARTTPGHTLWTLTVCGRYVPRNVDASSSLSQTSLSVTRTNVGTSSVWESPVSCLWFSNSIESPVVFQ